MICKESSNFFCIVQLLLNWPIVRVHGIADATRRNAHEAIHWAAKTFHWWKGPARHKRLVSYARFVNAEACVTSLGIERLVPDQTAGAMFRRHHKTAARRRALVMNLRRGLLAATKPAVQVTRLRRLPLVACLQVSLIVIDVSLDRLLWAVAIRQLLTIYFSLLHHLTIYRIGTNNKRVCDLLRPDAVLFQCFIIDRLKESQQSGIVRLGPIWHFLVDSIDKWVVKYDPLLRCLYVCQRFTQRWTHPFIAWRLHQNTLSFLYLFICFCQ